MSAIPVDPEQFSAFIDSKDENRPDKLGRWIFCRSLSRIVCSMSVFFCG